MSNAVTKFNSILRSDLLQRTIRKHFGNSPTAVVYRPKCFVIRRTFESGDRVTRIVVLPPKGCTADKMSLLNPHPEARTAKAFIYGEIDPLKKGYKPIVGGIELRFSKVRSAPTQQRTPYAAYNSRYCATVQKSWKNWFYTVKESGWGNFHNLVNRTSTWVVLVVEKQLLDQKPITIESYIKVLGKRQSSTLRDDLQYITTKGDEVFTRPTIIRRIVSLPLPVIASVLIQMLNVQETGKHQNCTFFALILKLSRRDRVYVRSVVDEAAVRKSAPRYYLAELQKKLL